jgi:putative sugar O-methyltransferase
VLKTLKNKTLASLKSRYFLFCRNFYKFSSKIIYFFNFSENENFHENYHLYKKIYIEKLGDMSNCQKFIMPMWEGLAEDIRKYFMGNFKMSFLKNEVIRRTMFLDYGGSALQKMEIKYLEKTFSKPKLKYLLKESKIGHPTITYFKYWTSHNSIHQLYHLNNFSQETGSDYTNISQIVEWGGGYGCLAKILMKINPNLTYIIIDLPIFSIIQAVYTSTIFGSDKINIITDENKNIVKNKINIIPINMLIGSNIKILNTDIFISTWALSESTNFSQEYVESVDFFGAKHLLIAHQQKSPEVKYAESIDSHLKNYQIIYHEKIPNLKNNYYLFCKLKNNQKS